MKHFRILEIKKNNKKTYIIQYLKEFLFNFHIWKKLNNKTYARYEEALSDVKYVIKQEDYDNSKYGYHYVDAYKIFKYKEKDVKPEAPEMKNSVKKVNKSSFIQNKTSTWKTNCRKCNSPVFYYPAKLLLESKNSSNTPDYTKRRIVDCTCTEENEKGKHTLSYTFPDDFKKIE